MFQMDTEIYPNVITTATMVRCTVTNIAYVLLTYIKKDCNMVSILDMHID